MADGQVVIDVLADFSKATRNIAAGTTKIAKDVSKGIAGPLNSVVNVAAVGIIAGVAVGLTAGARAAIEFEDSFALVKKTMADVEDPMVFKEIASDLQTLATQIPVRSAELAQLASVAGQLGVRAEDVAQFVDVTGKLSVATNLTGTQAATSLARFLNVTNQTTDTVGKFGSVLVELGNNVAANESEIILLAQNFGATGTIAGLSAEDILAFSAATRETGVQAAAGSTALGKFFMNLSDAAKLGGDKLETFATTAGMSVAEFRKLAEEDVASAAQAFLEGLNGISAAGESVTPVLTELGLNNVRTARSLLSLANNSEGLAEALSLARKEAVEQNALNKEAETRFETVAQKVNQVKSTFNVFLQQLGEGFLPLISKVLDGVINFTKGLVGLVRGFKELGNAARVFLSAGAIGTVVKAFMNLGKFAAQNAERFPRLTKVLAGAGNAFKTLGRFVKIAAGPLIAIAAAIGGIMKIGKLQGRFDDFNQTVDQTTNSIKELTSGGEEFAEVFNEEVLKGIAEGLPESISEGVMEGIQSGKITEAGIESAVEFADALSSETVNALRNAVDVGDLVKGTDNLKEIEKVIEGIRADGLEDEFSEVLSLSEEIKVALENGNDEHSETVKFLRNQIALQLSFIEGQRNQIDAAVELRKALIEAFGIELFAEGFMKGVLDDLESMEEFLSSGRIPKNVQAVIDEFGLFKKEVKDIVDPMERIVETTKKLQEQVDALFKPAELEFAKQLAQFDLTEAIEEQNELIQEELDLREEALDLTEELTELESKQVETAEELAEQQELVNEALEIEQRLRDGMALTANQQLQREKLRKDRRRVELAAQQGSLEFADLELLALDEKITAIEDSAVTQADADEKRAKALAITEKAQERRQKDIENVEKRRVEINERLAELPRDQVEASKAVLDAQKAIVDANIAVAASFTELSSVTQQNMVAMAKSLGIPVGPLNNLFNAAKSYFNFLPSLGGITPQAISAPSLAEQVKASFNQITKFKPGARAMGGSVKPSQNYVVGERGPEMLKMFPGGGGYVTPMGEGAGMNQTNNLNLNITGLPTDPIAARRIAQNIQRELNKLSKDGRSGVVR